MAQRGGKARLAQRYGVSVRAGLAFACVALTVVAGAVLALGTSTTSAFVVEREAEETQAATEEDVQEELVPASPLVVHVDGAVAVPGVYELPEGSRVNDAIECAGGLAADADTSGINLAATIQDGEKIYVPAEGEEVSSTGSVSSDLGGSSSAASSSGLVNINTADATELQLLPGVGEATAAAIIEDREANGPFSSPEDIMRVSGIGEKKFAKMEAMICV